MVRSRTGFHRAGLEVEIVRFQQKKKELLDLFLDQDRQNSVLTREEFENKAAEMNSSIKKLETEKTEMQERARTKQVSVDEEKEALRILSEVRVAGVDATFQEKRAIIRRLNVKILYDGVTLELTGSVPTRTILPDELRNITRDTPILQPQSEPAVDSPQAQEDRTILSDPQHTMGCMHS